MISEGEGIAFNELYFRYLYHAFSLAQTLDSGLAPSHFYVFCVVMCTAPTSTLVRITYGQNSYAHPSER